MTTQKKRFEGKTASQWIEGARIEDSRAGLAEIWTSGGAYIIALDEDGALILRDVYGLKATLETTEADRLEYRKLVDERNRTPHYMNPNTGSVDSLDGWGYDDKQAKQEGLIRVAVNDLAQWVAVD